MKVLITGVNGFVGDHLTQELLTSGEDVCGTDLSEKNKSGRIVVYPVDLLDQPSVKELIEKVRPDRIYHLAGQSNVGFSWKNPLLTYQVNMMGTLNLLESIRIVRPETRTLIIGSSDQYGIVHPEMCPIPETMELNPKSPYAQSKKIQEELCRFYFGTYNLNVVMVRAFNHIGPGQNPGFVIPDFASKIARVELGLQKEITVGNLEAYRDFSDVRDIVHGYRLLMQTGKTGEIYNIGSGRAYKISDVLDILLSYAKKTIRVVKDPNLMRPSDAPLIYGDCSKIKRDTGYKPMYHIEETLKEVLDDWRNRLIEKK